MRRFLLVMTSLALLIASALGMVGQTQAHLVTVDGTTTEWTSFGESSGPSTDDNTGHIIRNASNQGEYFWNDEANDQRIVDSTTIYTREVDLRDVRVTGNATNMYMYVKLGGTTKIAGNDLVELQVALDTDLALNSGQTQLVAPATASPTVTAPWERLLQTQFSSVTPAVNASVSTAALKVYSAVAPTTPTTPAGAVSAISKADNIIELSVPWSALGFSGPPATPVRFTVVSLRDNGALPPDGGTTNILDTLSPSTSGATGLANTQNELADGQIDYSFQVNFESTGEVYSPLLITEVSVLPSTTAKTSGDSTAQWFELTNVSGATISGSTLAQYKVGDATQRGTSESMFSLANLSTMTLAANQSLIFARDPAFFKTTLTSTQLKSVYALTTTTKLGSRYLTAYPSWAGTDFGFSTSSATQLGDQVVLLDSANTVADLVEFSNTSTSTYPDHRPVVLPSTLVGAAPNLSIPVDTDIQRCPATRDTNNRDPLTSDFVVTTAKSQQTPLAACAFTDLYATVSGAQTVQVQVQAAVTQNYIIAYGNNRQPASGVVVTDTLPAGMTYVSGLTQGASEPTVSTDANGRTQLVWNIGAVASSGTGQIVFTTSVAASSTAPAASSHTVTISGSSATPELQNELANNSFNLPVAYTVEPVVNLAVTKALNTSKSQLYAGGKLVYTISYTNIGNKPASDVTLVDTFPSGLTYLSNSANLAISTPAAGQIQFAAVKSGGQPLAAGGTSSFDITFAIPESLSEGSVVPANQVAVSTSTAPETDASNNTASSQTATLGTRPPAADLVVTTSVQDDSKANPGGTIVYTVAHSNAGQLNASSITLIDSFPDSLEYVSNSARLTPDQSVAGQLKFNLVPMVPGDHGSFQLTFTVKSSVAVGTTVQNEVTIATTSVEAPSSNNIATSATTSIRAATTSTATPMPSPSQSKKLIYLPIVRKP